MLGTVIFIFGILILLGGIGVGIFMVRESEGGLAATAFAVGILLGGGLIIGSMVGSVETKKLGVVTSYNKPTGEVKEAGAFLVAPWESVTEMDAAKQVDPYSFDVQLAGGAKATLTVYPSWQMAPSAAPDLFQDYKSFDNVEKSLFSQQLVSTANDIFGSYNPLTNIDPKTGELKKSKVQWASELKTALEQNVLIKDKLIINSISIPTIQPDGNTQNNLNLIVAEFARGSVLDQQKLNADKQAAITAKNAEVDKQSRCLEIAEAKGGEPGLCLSSGAGVILNKPAK